MTNTQSTPNVGRPQKQVDLALFQATYRRYRLKEIDKDTILKILDMKKTAFHKLVKQLREEGYYLPTASDLKEFNGYEFADRTKDYFTCSGYM